MLTRYFSSGIRESNSKNYLENYSCDNIKIFQKKSIKTESRTDNLNHTTDIIKLK